MWWTNKKQRTPASTGHSYFPTGVIIEGHLSGNDNIRIDGRMNGTIHCSGKIVIGNDAVVTGDVQCNNLDIKGILNGNICIQGLLVLYATCTYRGDALVSRIQIEPGGNFDGTCAMLNQKLGKKIE